MKHIISLGGGIQSTTMLLMACHDEITPKPICAIFADTGWEREQTYKTVKFLFSYAVNFGIPVYTVSSGNIRVDSVDPEKRKPMLPFYQDNGKKRLPRQCTYDYKIRPVRKLAKRLTDATHKAPYTTWIGYSIDEVGRMSPSKVKYAIHRYPLIENRMDKGSCYKWLEKSGFPAPVKSACIGCPCHRNDLWEKLTDEEIADCDDFEKGVQASYTKLKHTPYLHRSCDPIEERPFESKTLDAFDSETEDCQGGCWL